VGGHTLIISQVSATADFCTTGIVVRRMSCFYPFVSVPIPSVQSQPRLLHCRRRRLLLHLVTNKETQTR